MEFRKLVCKDCIFQKVKIFQATSGTDAGFYKVASGDIRGYKGRLVSPVAPKEQRWYKFMKGDHSTTEFFNFWYFKIALLSTIMRMEQVSNLEIKIVYYICYGWVFWLTDIGSLSAFVRIIDNATNTEFKIWSMTGNQGNYWYYAKVPSEFEKSFRIVFEGIFFKSRIYNYSFVSHCFIYLRLD